MSRRAAREMALKILFQVDVGKVKPEAAVQAVLGDAGLSPGAKEFALELAQGALNHMLEIDGIVAGLSVDWSLERMANTDRNVLRIAVYELLHQADVPPAVAVNEAVRLAKRYGDAESGKFVNGILGSLVRSRAPLGPDQA